MARKANAAFMKPVQPDEVLGDIVGHKAMPRTEITKKIWAYIKNKTNAQDGRDIHISKDDKLQALAPRKKTITMFELTKVVSQHVS